jgi:hypothetical protein
MPGFRRNFVSAFITIKKTMAKEIKTAVLINATPQTVWRIFSNFENYPQWNPFIKLITGDVKTGHRITARIEPPGAKGMTFKPRVLAVESEKELRWLGHLLVPGLFDGEHRFELVNNGNGTTTFIQSEIFKGILVPLFKKMLDQNTKAGFEQMNEKLKALCEMDAGVKE